MTLPDTMKPQCKKDILSQVFVLIARSQHKINLPQLSLLTGFLNKEGAYTSAITETQEDVIYWPFALT